MRFQRRSLVLLIVVAGVFAYGFTAGAYRLPPFYQVAWMKNSLLERFSAAPAPFVPEPTRSVEVMESALQRLLLKRIQLPNSNDEFVGGGALATAGDLLYVITSHGDVSVFDVVARQRLATNVDTVPINRPELMRSRMRYAVTLFWFRVSGAFAEVEDDSTHTLFVAHNRYDAKSECFTFNISRITLRRAEGTLAQQSSWRTIFSSAPCMTLQSADGPGRHPFSGHISGGKMIAYDDHRLLVSVGDFTFDGDGRAAWARDRSNPYGKFLLVDKESGRSEIFAVGARNDMGLTRDSSGTIWATESGPQGGDELNVIVPGADLGWPDQTYGINYESNPWPMTSSQGRHDLHREPWFAWNPSIVPTNIVRMEGNPGSFELWRGDLILGTLRDQSLHRLRIGSAGRVVYDERIPLGDRVRDLVRLPDGTLALLTDATGFLLLIADGGPVYSRDSAVFRSRVTELEKFDSLVPRSAVIPAASTGRSLFAQRCATCHSLSGPNLMGPPLGDVFSRGVGRHRGYVYSERLVSDGRQWTPELLREYLMRTGESFAGTRMQSISLKPTEVDSIVGYLATSPR